MTRQWLFAHWRKVRDSSTKRVSTVFLFYHLPVSINTLPLRLPSQRHLGPVAHKRVVSSPERLRPRSKRHERPIGGCASFRPEGKRFLVPGKWNVLACREGLPVRRVGEKEKYRQYSNCGMFQMLQILFKTQTRRNVRKCEAGSPPRTATPFHPRIYLEDIHLSVCLSVWPYFAVHQLRQSQLVQPKHRSYCLSTLWSKCASLKTKVSS